jgi:protein tyrosine/serine phosphatase
VTRALDWDGCLNVRDLGGVPLEGGGETRSGSLIRSDNVGRLTDDGWRSLAAHGIARIVDLRWPEELAEDEPRDVDIDVVHVSLLGALGAGIYVDPIEEFMAAQDPTGYWAHSYISMLEEYPENFGNALAAIADTDGPVVFHCAGGKDRTGLVAALLLRLAGAPIEEVARDYALTAELVAGRPNEWVDAAADEREHRRRSFMQNTPAEAMQRALEHVEREHGGVDGYLHDAGLTEAQLDRLRGRLAAA